MVLPTHLERDRLLMGSPVVVLAFATIIHLSVFASIRPDMLSGFERALARSTALAARSSNCVCGFLLPAPPQKLTMRWKTSLS
jgi:hypothetical protein